MSEYCMITTAFDKKEEADKIINILLEKRLASCCQLIKIESSYHWQGRIEHTNEFLLQIKTKKVLYDEVEKQIIVSHSYDTPEIAMFDIKQGSKKFLDWIELETK